MLRISLFCALFLIAACGPDATTDGPLPTGDPSEVEPPKGRDSPPTGIPRIQADHDMYAAEIAEIEEALGEDKAPDSYQARVLSGLRQGIDYLTVAAKLGRDSEAEQGARVRHARLREANSKLQQQRNLLWREMLEIKNLLERMEKGIDGPPAGFTEAELRDKLEDLRREDTKFVTRDEEIRADMKKEEDLLKLDSVPTEGRTLFTEELTALEKLRERVDALLSRSR